MKPEVKVCGVRDVAFAVAAAKLGVDYLGFIFEPSSPRHVTVSQAAEIAASLAGGAEGDGVLFDSSHGDGERELRRGAYRTILAGGVSAGNVAMAVATGPDVLDVNSSLETAPGIKSAARLEDFMRAFAAATAADNAKGRE